MDQDNQTFEQVVSDSVECLVDEMRDEFEGGTTGEPLRECLMERVHEHCDGHRQVIMTWRAQALVGYFGTDAYTDNFGEEGLIKDGDINYSAIAYCILEQAIYEEMRRQGFDCNDPTEFFETEAEEAKEAS